MSEESRFGRESTEFMHALKRVLQAGVKVYCYLDGREVKLGTMADNITTYVRAEASAEERRKASQRTHAALAHKVQRGHVVGGRCFGYRNKDVITGTDKDGRPIRSHVTREINPAEAAVVRQIFEWYALGDGKTTIAQRLNADGAPSPRAQQGRPSRWSPSSVHEMLYRATYRGVVEWNRTRKRDVWGRVEPAARDMGEHMVMEAPELRIISDALWAGVQARQAENRTKYLRSTNGLLYGRPRDKESIYLLSGFLRCAHCGANWSPMSRSHGRKRAHFYHCLANHKRGPEVCACRLSMPMVRLDNAVLERVRAVLSPDIVGDAVDMAVSSLLTDDDAAKLVTLQVELATLEEAQRRLVTAITSAGDVLALTDALKANEGRRVQVAATVAAPTAARPVINPAAVRASAEAVAADLGGLLLGAVPQARQILRKLLKEPIQVRAREDGAGVTLTGALSLSALVPPNLASPICTSWNQLWGWLRTVDALRNAA